MSPPVAKQVPPQAKQPAVKLRAAQIRILQSLNKSPMTKKELLEVPVCSSSDLTSYLGHLDPLKRKTNDEKWFPSLITLAYVKANVKKDQEKGTETYSITPAGKSALTRALKEAAKEEAQNS